MRKGKRLKKYDVDKQLLDSIYVLEREWKRCSHLSEISMVPTNESTNRESAAKVKYLFLHREARRRNISASAFY